MNTEQLKRANVLSGNIANLEKHISLIEERIDNQDGRQMLLVYSSSSTDIVLNPEIAITALILQKEKLVTDLCKSRKEFEAL